MLRTVAYAWQQEALADNARDVFELGKELYKRLGTFGGHMDKLGRSLTSAAKTYNDAVGSLERNVLSQARKLNELKIVDADLDQPKAIEEPVRLLGAAELLDGAERTRPVVSLPVTDDETAPLLDGRPEDYGIDAAAQPAPSRDWRTGS